MKVVLIGSGNVATVLGKLIAKNNHEIIQVVGRNKNDVEKLAEELNAIPENNFENIFPDADIYIIAVSDNAVEKIAKTIRVKDKIVVHTSGSLSKNILKITSINYGVIYPLQSLKKEIKNLPAIPLIIDGSSRKIINDLISFAKTLSPFVETMNDEQRLNLHIAAIISSNFTNYLYALTEKFCISENIPFQILLPLIEGTANRIKNLSPAQTQTGPAFRGDVVIIKKHLRLLKKYPEIKKLYKYFSENIMQQKSPPK